MTISKGNLRVILSFWDYFFLGARVRLREYTYIQGRVYRGCSCSRIFILPGKLTSDRDILDYVYLWYTFPWTSVPPPPPRYTYLEVHFCGHTGQPPPQNCLRVDRKNKHKWKTWNLKPTFGETNKKHEFTSKIRKKSGQGNCQTKEFMPGVKY